MYYQDQLNFAETIERLHINIKGEVEPLKLIGKIDDKYEPLKFYEEKPNDIKTEKLSSCSENEHLLKTELITVEEQQVLKYESNEEKENAVCTKPHEVSVGSTSFVHVGSVLQTKLISNEEEQITIATEKLSSCSENEHLLKTELITVEEQRVLKYESNEEKENAVCTKPHEVSVGSNSFVYAGSLLKTELISNEEEQITIATEKLSSCSENEHLLKTDLITVEEQQVLKYESNEEKENAVCTKPHEVSVDSNSFVDAGSLLQTELISNEEEQITISNDDGRAATNSFQKMMRPVDIDANGNELSCFKCGIPFTKRHNLYRHIRNIHKVKIEPPKPPKGPDSFPCTICKKTFSRKANLERHLFIHQEGPRCEPTPEPQERNYECETCGAAFKRPSHLKEHELTHAKVKKYKCEDCGKTFVQKSNLETHKKFHEDVREHGCAKCGLRFVLKAHLQRHMERKHKAQ